MACPRRIRWISTLAALLTSVACDASNSARRSAGGAVAVRDSAGVTIVENAEVEPADVARWAVDTTPSITIGTSAGDSAYEFARIGGVQQLPNGMIVVLNGRGEAAFEFRFYDSTGKHIATHGRLGQGPGEYRWINFFGSVGGDTVIGVDFPNSRLNWVSASRGHLRSTRLAENGFQKVLGDDAYGIVETMVPLGDSLYAVLAFRRMPNASSPSQRSQSYHIVDLAGDTALDLVRYEGPPAKMLQLSGGNRVSLRPDSTGRPAHVVDRARMRICALINSVTEISCIDRNGKRTSIRWRGEGVPYTDEDRRADDEAIRKLWGTSRGATPQDVEKILAAREPPQRHKPVAAFQMDTEGNFWILEPTLDSAGKRRSRFRVLAPDGRQIAFADSFPARNVGLDNNIHIGADAVLRVFENPDGAPVVGVFRIRKPE